MEFVENFQVGGVCADIIIHEDGSFSLQLAIYDYCWLPNMDGNF
jgi:hypothetical protein